MCARGLHTKQNKPNSLLFWHDKLTERKIDNETVLLWKEKKLGNADYEHNQNRIFGEDINEMKKGLNDWVCCFIDDKFISRADIYFSWINFFSSC